MTNQHTILKQQLDVITGKLGERSNRQSECVDDNQQLNSSSQAGGTTSTQRGRTTCPDTAELIYEGMSVHL